MSNSPKVINRASSDCQDGAVFIGRPSVWGNPFVIGRDGDRAEVVLKFENYIRAKPALMTRARTELRGKNLLCFCAPRACHGDVLLRIANEDDEL
jgi:hypothetical protein